MDLGKVDITTMLAAVVVVFILLSCSSVVTALRGPKMKCTPIDDEFEEFGNEEEYVKKNDPNSLFEYKTLRSYNFKRAELSSLSTENNYPTSLLTGQADRYLINDKFYLEVYSHLYVLGGDPFDKTDLSKINHKYSVYLLNNGDRFYVGDLKKDGDGIYKLKMTIENKPVTELLKFNKVNIVYTLNNKEQLLLEGEFKQ